MSEFTKKKRSPRKGDRPSSTGREEVMLKKKSPPAKNQQNDSEDIERAVYDGMQDLRAEKPK